MDFKISISTYSHLGRRGLILSLFKSGIIGTKVVNSNGLICRCCNCEGLDYGQKDGTTEGGREEVGDGDARHIKTEKTFLKGESVQCTKLVFT